MRRQPVVVDTNVLFSALLNTESRFAAILLRSEHSFYICESVLAELFRHKEKILRLSQLDDDDLTRFYHILLRRLHVHKEDLIAPEHWRWSSRCVGRWTRAILPTCFCHLDVADAASGAGVPRRSEART